MRPLFEKVFIETGFEIRGSKIVQIRAGRFGEKEGRMRGEFRNKKCKRHKCHPEMNLCSKFHLNRTMGNCSKLGQV